MAQRLDSATRDALVERVRFYRDLGLTEFYRRPVDPARLAEWAAAAAESKELAELSPSQPDSQPLQTTHDSNLEDKPIPPRKPISAPPETATAVRPADPAAALQQIREELGDCTRCGLHKGRNKLVFGDGSATRRRASAKSASAMSSALVGLPH